MSALRDLALTLRFVLELAAIVAVAWWGFALDAPGLVRAVAGVGAALAVVIVWGAFVAPRARVVVSPAVRLGIEGLVWLAAVLALVAAGATNWAIALAALVLADRLALWLTAGQPSRLESRSE